VRFLHIGIADRIANQRRAFCGITSTGAGARLRTSDGVAQPASCDSSSL